MCVINRFLGGGGDPQRLGGEGLPWGYDEAKKMQNHPGRGNSMVSQTLRLGGGGWGSGDQFRENSWPQEAVVTHNDLTGCVREDVQRLHYGDHHPEGEQKSLPGARASSWYQLSSMVWSPWVKGLHRAGVMVAWGLATIKIYLISGQQTLGIFHRICKIRI